MQEEINEFVEALYRFVANEIKRVTDPIYCQEGIKIVPETISSASPIRYVPMKRKTHTPCPTFAS